VTSFGLVEVFRGFKKFLHHQDTLVRARVLYIPLTDLQDNLKCLHAFTRIQGITSQRRSETS